MARKVHTPPVGLDEDIARYEAMSSEEIDAELQRLGIDPEPTIKAVTALVRAKLQEWREQGLLPPKPVQ